MRPATRVLKAGLATPEAGEPFLAGPTFAAPFHTPGDPTDSPYSYGRLGNPTWARLETAIGSLEGGETCVFSSGMAAVSAVLGCLVKPHMSLVLPSDGYYAVRQLTRVMEEKIHVQIRAATSQNDLLGLIEGAGILWLETPTNPQLEVYDVGVLAAEARRCGGLVIVDNTTATCLGQQPLELGADVSLASGTKGLTGHSDLLLGYVASRDPDLISQIRTWRSQNGAILGPMEAWLAHRSLATLYLRMQQQCKSALQVAEFLSEQQPKVSSVRYPGLKSDPAYPVASRQMRHFGPIVSFVLPTKEKADAFLSACDLILEATSFGGIHSSAERRARWGGDQVEDGFIRLSVGCEDPADLLEDLEQALAAC